MAGQSKMTGNLTARDQELAAIAWACFEGEPKIDMDKFAGAAGFSNINSARACWGPVKKKLLAQARALAKDNDADPYDAGLATPKTKGSAKKTADNTGSKRKAKAMNSAAYADDISDGDDLDIDETPSKKTKKIGIKTEDGPIKKEERVKDEKVYIDEV
ncbi:hypothetical protein PG993_011733 [Apiospora rasikravindrae]|uniref:Uncharacterized protein n=1 Tax=Apiospora rasikravindrae TaxID=990691 RepID=A0ABR1S0F7_9PEZI